MPFQRISNCYEREWEVKGKDPDAHRSEMKKGFIKGSAVIEVRKQAGVKIPDSHTQGESKARVGTGKSDIHRTSNKSKLKHIGLYIQGEGYTEKILNDQQTKTGKEYKYQTYKHRKTRYRMTQGLETGISEINQGRNRKKTQKTNSPGATERCRLNTPGIKHSMRDSGK